MKMKLGLIFIVCIHCFYAAAQGSLTKENLIGDWKIIKYVGDDDDKDIIGSVFHFLYSGTVISEMPATGEDKQIKERNGTWKIQDKSIVLYKEFEDPNLDKGAILEVIRFEGNMLFLHDEKEKVSVVFERIKN